MTRLTHLERLDAEAIRIMREVVAECANPVMLHSIGKDSTVMLHLAAVRPVVRRDDTLIMGDDGRMSLLRGEVPDIKRVRFRTLGCCPLTGAVGSASMEQKKQNGYF